MVKKITDLTYKARRHDKLVIAHLLARPFNGVMSDPGTGKSSQVLAAFHVLKMKRLIDRMLVVGPINAIHESWPGEIARWGFPYEMTILHGDKKDQVLDDVDANIYGINFDGLKWLEDNIDRLLCRGKRWWLIVDESHNLKDTSTRRFKSLKPMLPLFGRRTVLTGTPRPQGLEDLFGQTYIVDLGEALGKYITHYRREFFHPAGYGGYGWAPNDGAEKKIYKRLSGMFIRVDESVLDLPPINDVPVYVHLPDDARKAYKEMEKEFVVELDSGAVTAVNSGVKSMKLRQIANGFVYQLVEGVGIRRIVKLHAAKVDAIRELVEGLGGSPLLVGYEFEADAESLAEAFSHAPIVGHLPPQARRRIFREFNDGRHPVMLAQTGAASESLNLQEACHHVALFGLPWKVKDYIQFRKRVHRSGQRHPVTVHHILAKDTVDDKVMWPVLKRRGAEQEEFFKALRRVYGKK